MSTHEPFISAVGDHCPLAHKVGTENPEVITNATLPTEFPSHVVTKGRGQTGVSHSLWVEQDSALAPGPFHNSIPSLKD